LVLAGLSFAPAPQQKPYQQPAGKKAAEPASLSERRLRAASKQFDLIWGYYRQSRVSVLDVYIWSRLLLDAQREADRTPAGRIEACSQHLERMKRLDALLQRVKRFGFIYSSDLGSAEYFRVEAEYWLAEARGR
jgi:hypothetical protein